MRAEAIYQATTDNCRQCCREGQRYCEETSLKRAQGTQLLQIDWQEDHASEEAESNQRVGDVAEQKWAVGKETQIDERLPAMISNLNLNDDEQSKQAEASNQCNEDRGRIPSVGRRIGESIEYSSKATGSQHKSRQVEARACFGGPFAQEQPRHDNGNNPYRHIDIEDHPPGDKSYKVATQGGANRWSHQRGDPQNADSQAALVGREFVEQQRNCQGEERCAADSLYHAKDNQHR